VIPEGLIAAFSADFAISGAQIDFGAQFGHRKQTFGARISPSQTAPIGIHVDLWAGKGSLKAICGCNTLFLAWLQVMW
jgi:hypothetical protein